ncbi:MAG: SusC/RagA family TonB-linked outer membrane protein [Pedobacter sp.]|nr:MAG: SusC/RagA family TonB-linked outer membrane protein [Pedobacter sp.]
MLKLYEIGTGLKSLVLTALGLLLAQLTFAQVAVTGKVTDKSGQPLAGVSVSQKGTSVGATSDATGSYSINAKDSNTVLVFSYVGYPIQEITLGNRSSLDVTLSATAGQLNEVVVIGYGTQKRKEVTSAVATVSSEQFNKGNISDVSQLLQGKVSGLSISRPGGNPNGGFTIRLRGLSTLGANTSPLVVVDGQIGADINTIDPNDIQSMDVLKDAASAAIYGTRGSSGVIIITTKKGGRTPIVNYNGSVTSEKPTKFTPHMSAEEFKAAGGRDLGANTDWNKAITRNAISHIHNLSLSGGTGTGTNYIGSINYRNSEGVAINTGFSQLNAHFGLNQRALKDKLLFTVDVTSTRRESDFGFDRAFQYATIFNPTAPLSTTDPTLNLTGSGYVEQNFVEYANPLAVLQQNTNKGTNKRTNFNASVTYEIIKGLKFLTRYAQQTSSNYRWLYLPKTSFDSRLVGTNGARNGSGFSRNGLAQKQDDENFSQLYENTLSYDRQIFGKMQMSAIAGYSYQDFMSEGFLVQAGDFITDVTSENIAGSQDLKNGKANATSYKNGSRLVGFFGRLNLNWDDLAFVSASLRREGSTQFGENNKWGMFPAVSAGVDLSRIANWSAVSSLKLRASYGVTGALPPSSYLSLFLYGPTANNFLYNGNYIPSYEPTQNSNPDLKWERKAEFDIGVDFSAFDNRLTGSIDYYSRNTNDLLFNATVPVPPFPTSSRWMNIGTLKNTGVEFLIGYDVVKGSTFEWNTSVNFSTFNIELSKLNKDLAGTVIGASNLGSPGQEATQITRAVEGEPIGIIWGAVYKGVDAAGKFIFADSTGKDTDSDAYKTQIGHGLPKFELGFTNTFKYKNWDLNFFLRGSFGHDIVNTYRAFFENSTPTVVASYNVVKTKYYNTALTTGQTFSSLYVERASFVKLDNATLGYNFNLKNTNAIKSIRAFINAQNLFVITDYTGVDPEVRYTYGGNVLAPGVDARDTWVRTRALTFGVSVRF